MREFFLTKAYALFHDPPDKMWGLKGHEERAWDMFNKVRRGSPLDGELPEWAREVVKLADRMAASMDRYAFYSGGGEGVKYDKLHNLFNPRLWRALAPPDPGKVAEYVENLGGRVRAAKGPREAYHVLYALFEALWIDEGLGPSLADPRAPTHDVFDHLYATAMVANWLLAGGKPSGYFVTLDVPGVQDFVKAGRKAGDIWAGSWALSMAVWLTVWPFAWEYGPDVLLRPTARLNPYYYAFAAARGLGVEHGVFAKLLSPYVKGESFYDLVNFAVVQPLIGERAQIVLPPYRVEGDKIASWGGAEEVREAVRDRFKRAVECLTHFAKGQRGAGDEYCEDFFKVVEEGRGEGRGGGEVEKIAAWLQKYAELRLPLRVEVVDVGAVYDSIKCPREVAKAIEEALGDGEERCKILFLFDAVLRGGREGTKLVEPQRRRFIPTRGPWFKPGGYDDLNPHFNFPLDPNWRVCSLCGSEPAVVGVRKVAREGREDYNEEDLRRISAEVGIEVSRLKNHLRKVLRPGEYLGPVCLAKRLIYLRAADRELIKFESTEDVAVVKLAESHEQHYAELDRVQECVKVVNYLRTTGGRDLEVIWGNPEAMRRDWDNCFKKFGRLRGVERLVREIFGVEGDVGKAVEEFAGPRLFYAVVRADGDSVGKLLEGHLPVNWYGAVAEVVEGVGAEGREKALEVLRAVEEHMRSFGVPPPVVITPTYRVAVNRAMVLTSLKDLATTEKHRGLLIYAGGDDVVALLPVETALDAAAEYRENYWGEGGFHIVDNYPVPALAAYGRSTAVRFVHLMDLMSEELGKSYHDLEHLAKGGRWDCFEKDSLTITSSRVEAKAVLPFRRPREAVERLKELWLLMALGRLSKNAPHDLDAYEDLKRDLAAYLKAWRYALKRNARELSPETLTRLLCFIEKYGAEAGEGLKEAMKILRRLP